MLLPQVGQKALFNCFFKNVLDEKNKDSCVCVVCNPAFMKKWGQFDKKVEENKKKDKANQKKLNRCDLYQNIKIFSLTASKRNHAMHVHTPLLLLYVWTKMLLLTCLMIKIFFKFKILE